MTFNQLLRYFNFTHESTKDDSLVLPERFLCLRVTENLPNKSCTDGRHF